MKFLASLAALSTITTVLASNGRQTPLASGGFNAEPGYLSHARRTWLSDILGRWMIPSLGLQVLQQKDDGSWHEETFLWGNKSQDTGELLTADHTWAIASNSKLFAGLALSMVIEDSQHANSTIMPLTWQTKVKSILGEAFDLRDKYAQEHMTLEDLTSMQTGFPRTDRAERLIPVSELEAQLPGIPFSGELRQKFLYSNINYNLIPLIFYRLLGDQDTKDSAEAYRSYVQRRIFDPANLTTATLDLGAAQRTGQRVEGVLRKGLSDAGCYAHFAELGVEEWIRRGRPVPRPLCTGESISTGVWTDFGVGSWMGAGGVSMSLGDLGRFTKLLLDPPGWLARHIAEATTPSVYADPPPPQFPLGVLSDALYGKGQVIEWYRGHLVHQHGGSVESQHTLIYRLPHRRLAIVSTLAEETYFWANYVANFAVLDDIIGVHKKDRWDYESAFMMPSKPSSNETLPTDAQPLPADSFIEGTYENVVYGRRQIQHQPRDSLGFNFADAAPAGINASETYITELDNIVGSHWIFTPYSGNIFNWTEVSVYPRNVTFYNATLGDWDSGPMGGRRFMSKVSVGGSAIFTEHGMGMFGAYTWSRPLPVDRRWETGSGSAFTAAVKAKAEVWFDRLVDAPDN